MELKNVHHWKYERDDLHILNIVFPSNPEKCQNLSIKTYEGMKHATMRMENVLECTPCMKVCTTSISNYKILETS